MLPRNCCHRAALNVARSCCHRAVLNVVAIVAPNCCQHQMLPPMLPAKCCQPNVASHDATTTTRPRRDDAEEASRCSPQVPSQPWQVPGALTVAAAPQAALLSAQVVGRALRGAAAPQIPLQRPSQSLQPSRCPSQLLQPRRRPAAQQSL